jgi:hypothetical protein
MSREIRVYAIAHEKPDGYFLVRENGHPDHRLAIPKDMSLIDAVKAIGAAHSADSIHIGMGNDLTVKPTVEIIAYLPLDESKPVKMPTSN